MPDLVIWALLLSMLASGATNPPPTMMISGENFGVRIISVHLLYGLIFIKHIVCRVQTRLSVRTASRLLGLANLSASCTWRRHFILSRVSGQHRHLLESSCPCCLMNFKVGHIVHSAKALLSGLCCQTGARYYDFLGCCCCDGNVAAVHRRTTQAQRCP